jgi:anaphase-promoting complex subunit 3
MRQAKIDETNKKILPTTASRPCNTFYFQSKYSQEHQDPKQVVLYTNRRTKVYFRILCLKMSATSFKERSPLDHEPLAIVKRYLELQQFDSATFICERTYARNKDQASLHYLAMCYRAQGCTSRAIGILQQNITSLDERNKYMLAICAIAEDSFITAERILLGEFYGIKGLGLPKQALHSIPEGAAGLLVLGDINRHLKRTEKAIYFYCACLERDPYLWSAHQRIHELGGEIQVLGGGASKFVNTTPDTGHIDYSSLENVFKTISLSYGYLCRYECSEALQCLRKLEFQQYNTSWVLEKVSLSLFEKSKYEESRTIFKKLRFVEPAYIEGMDIYSTVLWHLKDDVELSNLAHELVATHANACQTWCVVGNCFSLQKEHENALIFFQRAIDINPFYVYAYTLSGHEYVSNEDFDKATQFYRKAISIDPRHYNAWYGLGTIYFRQEKISVAKMHFTYAIRINPNSSILYCYLGMLLSQLQPPQNQTALQILEKAKILSPDNPQAQFQRAIILSSLNQYEESLAELLCVNDFVPSEASVHFQIGKNYVALNKPGLAWHRFNTAQDLDPKNTNMYKSHIDMLQCNAINRHAPV